jgi:3-isopropylmalate/(R)-2-methylmalate dehydratase large subunit
MVIEAGGKNGVIAPDETTFEYVRSRTDKPFEAVYNDADAQFYSDRHYDVTQLEPVVAKPHSPDNRALARECSDVKIDRVYIGSCTGGKTSDFLHAAQIIKGHEVKVPTYIVPATQKVYEDLFTVKYDGQTLSEILLAAGCIEPAAPSCAACLGGPKDTFGRMNEPEICVSTTNRNFPGRMGNKQSQVYLASPYTAAASALTGYVTDPREFLS